MSARAAEFGQLQAPAHWRTLDFISDLHLKPEEPGTFQAWRRYMLGTPADAVIILGDLFDAWIGDDAASPGSFEHRCGQVLAACPADLAFMRGNRDFLVGTNFLSLCGVRDLEQDPTTLTFDGRCLLLSHGDLLCIDDRPYQEFRARVRTPQWQQQVLALPLEQRRALAAQMRSQSQALQAELDPAQWAHADDGLARTWLQAAGASTLIHGHTHQPADHALGPAEDGTAMLRMVLSDWHLTADAKRAEVLRLQPGRAPQRLQPEQALAA